MTHQAAKLILEHAGTFVAREEAIRTALNMGMPLHEIRDYLDWLDFVRQQRGQPPSESTSQPSPQASPKPLREATPASEAADHQEAEPETGEGDRT